MFDCVLNVWFLYQWFVYHRVPHSPTTMKNKNKDDAFKTTSWHKVTRSWISWKTRRQHFLRITWCAVWLPDLVIFHGNKVSHNRKRNQTNNVNKLGETSQMSRQVHNNNFSSNLVSIFSFQIFNFGKTNYLESVSMNLTQSRGFVLFLFTLCSFSIQENKLLKAKYWQPYNP